MVAIWLKFRGQDYNLLPILIVKSHETAIRFGLPEDTHVQLVVIDFLGREIRQLADSNMKAGYHTVIWDGKDYSGQDLPSGIYVYRIIAGTFQDRKKLALVR